MMGALLRPVNVLSIKNYHDDEMLFQKKIPAGYEFTTLIKHSVHKTPVYEYYKVDKTGQIYVTGTSLMDLGWGVPSTFDDDLVFKDNMMVITNMNKPIDFLPFRISYIAKPRLILGNVKEINLMQYVDNYERIDISVMQIPYIIYQMRGEIDVFQEKG